MAQTSKKSRKHYAARGELKLHADGVKTATDGGACIFGHCNPKYNKSDNVSCMYRWQAHVAAYEDQRRRKRYDKWPLPFSTEQVAEIKTDAWKKDGKVTPSHVGASIPVPKQGDWFVKGPPARADDPYRDGKGKKITPGENFRKKSTWPYWHNSHHLIPNALFTKTLDEQEYTKQIREGLLKAPYNINHKINAMILPQDYEVARLLSLPRHLLQKRKGKNKAKDKTNTFNHPDYNIAVQNRLDDILTGYDQKWRDAMEDEDECGEPDVTVTVEELEELSEDCLKKILEVGSARAGRALDDEIAEIPFYSGE